MVAEIIDCEDAGRNAAESEAEEACIDRYVACLKEIGAADGCQPEKHQDDKFSKRCVSDRLGTAHVRVGGNERSQSDQKKDPAADPDEYCRIDER